MRVVIALGGNAILQRGEPLECAIQRKNIRVAAEAIAKVAKHHQVILTHGNGPQVGLLALMSESYDKVTPYPLDVLGAQTQGMIGAIFEQELRNCMPNRQVCTVLTQTLVHTDDPAFAKPDKFVGQVYDKATAKTVQQQNPHWVMKADGQYMRRVVASPMPQGIVELPCLKSLVSSGETTVICAGGGGVPVTQDGQGRLTGVEAVIDKDRASRILAEGLEADALLILSDVAAVATNYGQPDSRDIQSITPDQLDTYDFAAGSMGPKVEACAQFVRNGGKMAAIGSLARVSEILTGDAGTVIRQQVKGDVCFYDPA